MILSLVLVLPWMQVPNAIIKSTQNFDGLILMGALIIILLARYKETSLKLIDKICNFLSFLPKSVILARWEELLEGLTLILHRLVALKIILLSQLIWTFSDIVFFSAIQIFQPTGQFLESIFLMVLLSFAVVVPSSPGFIGVC